MSSKNSGPHLLRRSALAAVLGACALLGIACGKRAAPIPPQKPNQRAVVSGFQRGNQVILSWPMPLRNSPAGNVQNISRVDVYRLAEPATNPLQLSEEEFANRSTIITTVPVTAADFGANKTLQYRDTLQFAGQSARLRYAIRFVNAAGQKAPFSNALVIEPASKIAIAPAGLASETTQEAVRLTWQAPATNVDLSTPASVLGYNVYRSTSEKLPARLLTRDPVPTTSFRDEGFEFGKDYYYFVRAVAVGLGSTPVESAESNIVHIKPVDTFPPTAPSALTIAAAPGTISIFFAINPEKDIAGYKIYRSTDPDLDKAKWLLLTPELLKANTYQDTRVESGKRYYYYLTATDTAGNVSPMSEVISETAP